MTQSNSNTRRTGSLKTVVLAALAVVNGAMGLNLVSGMIADNTAEAQVARPSEYMMIPSRVSNLSGELLYVLDTQSGDIVAVAYDQTSRSMQTTAKIRLGQAFNQRGGN